MKTEWNFTQWYVSDTDVSITKDFERDQSLVADFNATYKDVELLKEDKIVRFFEAYEQVVIVLDCAKPLRYFLLRQSVESGSDVVGAQVTKYSEFYTKLHASVTWTSRAIAQIPDTFFESNSGTHYQYCFLNAKREVAHVLTDEAEHALQMMSVPGKELWSQTREKITERRVIDWKGESLPLSLASQKIHTLPYTERGELDARVIKTLKEDAELAEAELNSVVLTKKISDEMRGYLHPYSGTVLSYENDDSTVENLVSVVTKNYPISHSYSKLRAKLLSLETLRYCDRNIEIGELDVTLPYDVCVERLKTVFGDFHPKYKKQLETFIEKEAIDVFPKAGKRGGAFCSSGIHTPTVVLLNHDNTFNSYSTFAHELGHAFHSEDSKTQRPLYENYSIATAEVASTFFEQLAFDAFKNEVTDEQRIVMLDKHINEAIMVVFRQIAIFNYEHDLHMRVREEGMLTHTRMAELMQQHLQAYLGESYTLTLDDGYCFVNWPHLRYYFYVYSYAFGYLVSRALFERYKKDPTYRDNIMKFLSAGGSKQPEDIFSDIGINVRDPKFFEEGLQAIKKDIDELASLVASK